MCKNILAIIALITFTFSACNQKSETKQEIHTFKQTIKISASIQTPDKVENSNETL